MATKYVLLERGQHPDGGEWFRFVDTIEVDHGPEQAVRRFTEDQPAEDGADNLYLVIPQRNWNVVHRRVTIPAPRVEVDMIDWLPVPAEVPAPVEDPEPVNDPDGVMLAVPEAEALATSIEEDE